jgi:hypothetical protein
MSTAFINYLWGCTSVYSTINSSRWAPQSKISSQGTRLHMVHRHGACIHAATCQRYSGILTGNSAGQAARSIREIELATFHLYNRRPKQPSAVDWLELALAAV